MIQKFLFHYWVVLFFTIDDSYAQLYNPITERTRVGLKLEAGGFSPIFSLNTEYYMINDKKNFFCGRLGIGHLFTNYSLLTIPHSISYNILLNGDKNGCINFKSRGSLYIETGVGGVFLVKPAEQTPYRWSPVIGVRKFISYNVKANGYWSVQLLPIVAGRIVPYGSIGIGLLID